MAGIGLTVAVFDLMDSVIGLAMSFIYLLDDLQDISHPEEPRKGYPANVLI